MDLPKALTLSSKVRWHLLLFLLQAALFLECSGSETDRLALLAFKAAITHDPEGSLRSWNGTASICRWAGVSCSPRLQGRVVALVLESISLGGSISPSIGNLSFLARLHLPGNSLGGVIPSDIGRLRQLRDLNLSFNSLGGPIPPSLGQCRNLLHLDLTENLLLGNIPIQLGSLPQLTVLNLGSNGLAGTIPPSLGNLSSLQQLDLSSNELIGEIPPSLGNLSSLAYLNLSTNSLVGAIPPPFTDLLSLCYLDLSSNALAGGIPPLLGRIEALSVLVLASNNLTGIIPPSVGALMSLAYLDLSRNSLVGAIPPSFSNLSHLVVLELSENNLQGHLPEDIGHLTSLQFFEFSDNKISGTIPLSLYNISSLQTLSAVDNQLSGILSLDIGNALPNLLQLNLIRNQLEGPIPISLANASGLQLIDLGENKFSGGIPENLGSLRHLSWLSLWGNRLKATEANDWAFISSLTNCSQLGFLSLANNDLSGTLPTSIANLSTQLYRLTVGQNRIHGTIPPGIENLVNLTILGLNQNMLSGSIPDSIGKLGKLEALLLFSNKFSGTIPTSIGNLTRLNELYLDGNDLQSGIPPSLGNCQILNTLDLSSNHLSGSIPREVLSLSSLSNFLDLSSNFLDGPLPTSVGKLDNLQLLNISHNRLSGEIPTTIGDCQVLQYLYLEGNFFQGFIPSSLGHLKGIKMLDLSLNNLSGPFPDFLADLHYLQHVNLSFNDLDGEVPKEGVFKNASAVSILGNDKLCGGISDLHLPACPTQTSKKKRSLVLKVIVPVVCGILSLILLSSLFITCYLKRSSKKSSFATPSMDLLKRVSYMELMKATDDFSCNNLIGRGTFGSVYKGIMSDGETVAVKVLNLQLQGAFKTFMAECEALRNIRHRNLVKILTTCASVDFRGNDFRALVFQFMPNGSLEKWLHPRFDEKFYLKKLSLIQRLNMAMDVAAALNYLHNHCEIPIIHCDLKPSNILLDDSMTAHVGDFGLAKFLIKSTDKLSRDLSSASTFAIKGSIGYIAPEHGMGSQVSVQSDVYSYGILMLELFTGKRPTDDMFKDGLTLHKFVEDGLSKGSQVTMIVDPSLFSQESEEMLHINQGGSQAGERIERCLIAVLAIGLSCTKETPGERMEIKDAVTNLEAIKALLPMPNI
ncbi:LRR receptor-like serine/threonine-protein kinase EFR [Cocos nucifera]|uniref:Receptor kinase-like protein Xa21 n=1 Tax=Cocos nucifera TaxID=13894 RepID=A0A8K0IMK7_COCNU|nr:LRR receptor-like serine/threonine-protein kinase EFR [Cocos nucifera]